MSPFGSRHRAPASATVDQPPTGRRAIEARIDDFLREIGLSDPRAVTDAEGWRTIRLGSTTGRAGVVTTEDGIYLRVEAAVMPLPSDRELILPLLRELAETNTGLVGPARLCLWEELVLVVTTYPMAALHEGAVGEAIMSVLALADKLDGRLEARYGGTTKPRTPSQAEQPMPPDPPVAPPGMNGGLPRPAGLTWLSRPAPTSGWTQHWPAADGGVNAEAFTTAWQATVSLHGQTVTVRIGESRRDAAGLVNHGHLVVVFGPTSCEFIETRDGAGWAGIIRPDGRKTLPVGSTPPPLYATARLAPYREVTGASGAGVPSGLALVVARDDLESVVHHAAARRLAQQCLPVTPATD